jgi:5'(3')-deoxyribonucleotidase
MAGTSRRRIAIDMDEVMADFLAKHLALYNAEFGENVTVGDLRGKKLRELVAEERREKLEAFLTADDFFGDLGVVEGSREVISDLTGRYEVFVTTAAMDYPTSFAAKFRWLEEHFPFVPSSNVVFCGDKGIIAADFLIDDNARHFARFRGEGILFTAPHNVDEKRYRRVDDWQDVREMFL